MQGAEVTAHLHACWAGSPVAPGDAVNLIAEVYRAEAGGGLHAVLDDSAGLLVLHPDVLLSGKPARRQHLWLPSLLGGQ